MSQFADCCRVSIYSLVDPPGDEEMEPVAAQPTLLELLQNCDFCLDEMRKRGINESTMQKGVETAYGEKDSEGLEGLLAFMRNKILNHDQRAAIAPALDPAPSAPAASRAPSSSRPPNPNPSDSPSRTKSGQGRQAIAPTQSKAAKAAKPSSNNFVSLLLASGRIYYHAAGLLPRLRINLYNKHP